MNPYVGAVQILPGFRLRVTFTDGEVRIFDVTPFLDRGDFGGLREEGRFAQARVVAGSVEWPGGLDLSYDTLFLLGTPEGAIPDPADYRPERKVADPPRPYQKK